MKLLLNVGRRFLSLKPVAGLLAIAMSVGVLTSAHAITLEQIISRQSPDYDNVNARLTIGQDGRVYLANKSPRAYNGFVLRLERDGTRGTSGDAGPAAWENITANADGVIGVPRQHFSHTLALLSPSFDPVAALGDFISNDTQGYDSPSHVEAGPSGDFYGLDNYRYFVRRMKASGESSGTYAVPQPPKGVAAIVDFRVSEKQSAFWFPMGGQLLCVGFDGKTRWSVPMGWRLFDVDENGVTYLQGGGSDTIDKIGPDGKPAGQVVLQMGDVKATLGQFPITNMRVWHDEVLIKRRHPTEMFQRYSLTTGALLGSFNAKFERLSANFATDTWTAGHKEPFQVQLEGQGGVAPRWHVWARPFGTLNYSEFPLVDGTVQVPEDAAGLYDIRVTPETAPYPRVWSEYLLRARIQIFRPDSQGTVNVWTPANRLYYGRGETIPFSVSVRTKGTGGTPVPLTLQLLDKGRVLGEVKTSCASGQTMQWAVPAPLASGLRNGSYVLRATAPASAKLTSVSQALEIRPGMRDPGVLITRYGDYGATYPTGADNNQNVSMWDAPDVVAMHLERDSRFNFNMSVDRMMMSLPGWANIPENFNDIDSLRKRLAADPLAVAPEKVSVETPFMQTQAGYSSLGMKQMFILLSNDANLPIGSGGFDNRKPDQLVADLTKITTPMLPYPSFRGWSWAANNWLWDNGASAKGDAAQTAAYAAALKKARETGAWDPVLQKVSDTWFSYAPNAQKTFNAALKPIMPNAVTAWSPPYRNMFAYPPLTLISDETDAQAQWEQVAMPEHEQFGVDYYRRPGKKQFSHPEAWNDGGTGDQLWSSEFALAMRGANGVGMSGDPVQWGYGAEDSRQASLGLPAVTRSVYDVMRQYGPWLAALQNNDRVALVADGRMFRVDEWTGSPGSHYSRFYEAYYACLRAHHAASIIFTEDLTPDSFKDYKAILLIDQRFEPEPELIAALKGAQAAGISILADGTCRPEYVTGYKQLPLKFDQFEKASQAGDDYAFPQFEEILRANVPALRKALDAVAPADADLVSEELLTSQRKAEDGRYVFALNRTPPNVDVGQLWRMGLFIANRLPVRTTIGLGKDAPAVYDVFAMRRLTPKQGRVDADFSTVPMRLYAVLPKPIAGVALRGPASVTAGQAFSWQVRVVDAGKQAIRAAVPVRLRLLGADGSVLQERLLSVGSAGASGRMRGMLNAPAGAQTLEAVEMLSGQSARVQITVQPAGAQPLAMPNAPVDSGEVATLASAPAAAKAAPTSSIAPAEDGFGLHLRDVIVTAGGSLAVCNAMTWDNNVYAVDTKTGVLRWQRKVGNYYAYGPQAVPNGVAVQGFNFSEAEGYSLYLLDAAGNAKHRFALYGLPQRMEHRFTPIMIHDRINNFVADPAGDWFASAGDLGLAVWDKDGKTLWSQDAWKTNRSFARYNPTSTWASTRPPAPYMTSLDSHTLFTAVGMKVAAYNATTGDEKWALDLAPLGEITQARASADGHTVALLTTNEGGRVFLLRDGKVIREIATAGEELAIAPDGQSFAVTLGNQFKFYGDDGGMRWLMPGDEMLRFPRFSPAGDRLVVCSPIGTVYVADVKDGHVLMKRDFGGIAAPAWLPNGDLLLATWTGDLLRLDHSYKALWTTHLRPGATTVATTSTVEPTRMTSWMNADAGNAAAATAAAAPNLLAEKATQINMVQHDGRPFPLNQDTAALYDGKPDAPTQPWLMWGTLNAMAEGEWFTSMILDSFNQQMHVTGITFVEDPKHPESWLRDVYLEAWNVSTEKWEFVQPLLSDSAVHTHTLIHPVDTPKLRIVFPPMLPGNVRLGEVVIHGEMRGSSHPDIQAKRPVAVLFDENPVEASGLIGTVPNYQDVYSGKMSLEANGRGSLNYLPKVGHALANWGFDIAEKPEPGQYRYLQFAWKALSPATKSMSVCLGYPWPGGGVTVSAGDDKAWAGYGYADKRISATPPTEWQTVRVDLWALYKKPLRIQAMMFASDGGKAVFDRIVLGRTEADLDAMPAPTKP